MGVLDQIMQMKGQGIPDEQIVSSLTQSGVSPREISDAIKQAQIKNAVSNPGGDEELQPSIIQGGETPVPQPNQQVEEYQPQEAYAPQEGQQQYYAPEGGYAPAGIDTDTVMEIADQIFSEKTKKIQMQIDATSEAAIVLQAKSENISERLKKIESIIDRLQISILEKVGSYGQNLESVKKEMSMMQDSFSKMLSPSRESKRQPEEYPQEAESFSSEETERPQKRILKKK